MNLRTKTILILIGTLALGGIVGAFVTGAVVDQRMERIHSLRTQQGFADTIEQAIGLQDEDQRAQVRPILEKASARLGENMSECKASGRDIIGSMREELRPLLDDQQEQRLEAYFDKHRRGHKK
jgi:hypothetical protein